jgi:V/A-type H+-transporting ATPase subunit E
MSYNKNKLAAFEQAILAESNEKIDAIDQEIRDYEQTELAKAKDDEYNKMYEYMQRQIHEIENRYKQSLTKYELDSRRSLLLFRNELSEQVFESVREKLRAYTKTEEYGKHLILELTNAVKEFPYDDVTVLLQADDMKFQIEIHQVLPDVVIKEDPKNHLGGFILLYEEKGVLADMTYESALQEKKKDFYQMCGLRVQ